MLLIILSFFVKVTTGGGVSNFDSVISRSVKSFVEMAYLGVK